MTERRRLDRVPVAPTWPQSDLPSANQPGLVITVEKSGGDLVLAYSNDQGQWIDATSGSAL